jgi:type I restriction enzyme M protein
VKNELAVLKRWLELSEIEAALKKAIRELESSLDRLTCEKYPELAETEIKEIVIFGKWMFYLSVVLQSELDRVSLTLTGRVRELAERYVEPLPELVGAIVDLAARVDEHLKKMVAL